ncbi:MAG TPA: hypothetical protein VK890_00285, partial [Bacteroidia bacterium]|nr:hypothetical protein [Bacteroidia bacterium]
MGSVNVNPNEKRKKLYWWWFLGLLPNLGFIVGLILIYQGLVKYKDKKILVIGLANFMLAILYIQVLRYEFNHGTLFSEPQTILAQSNVNALVKSIEFYKIQHGDYPDSLKQL